MPTTSTGDDREGELPEYVVVEILDSDRRRRMLSILAQRNAPVVLDDLMRAVLAAERETTPGDISQAEAADVRTEAYEEHLPKLTAVDVVRYDSLLGTVELTHESIERRVTQRE